jgi:hypothetical protein
MGNAVQELIVSKSQSFNNLEFHSPFDVLMQLVFEIPLFSLWSVDLSAGELGRDMHQHHCHWQIQLLFYSEVHRYHGKPGADRW